MGPTTINGLPAHVLFVHFVVVMVPVAAIVLLLSLTWPAARRRLGILTPIIALVTLIAVPVTTHAGEWLRDHSSPDPLVAIHARLGDQMLYWSAGVFAVSVLWWLIHNDRATAWLAANATRINTATARKAVAVALVALGVLAAVGSVVQVYRIGDSGAKAVWHDQT